MGSYQVWLALMILSSGCLCCTLPDTEKKDIGVDSDPQRFKDILNLNDLEIIGSNDKLCLACEIEYSDTRPLNITLDSQELTSYMQATNNKNGLFKDIQILLKDDQMEMSANMDLGEVGLGGTMPIYARGKMTKQSPNTIAFEVYEAEYMNYPVEEEAKKDAEDLFEKMVNSQLLKMPNLYIEELETKDGSLYFKGDFPHEFEGITDLKKGQ